MRFLEPWKTGFSCIIALLTVSPITASEGPARRTHARSFISCIKTFEELASKEELSLPKESPRNPELGPSQFYQSHGASLALHPVKDLEIDGYPVVKVPYQEFLERKDAESIHRIVHHRYMVEGFYVLWSPPPGVKLPAQLDYHFDSSFISLTRAYKHIKIYLIPLDQYLSQRSAFDRSSPREWIVGLAAPHPLETKPGSITTGLGTHYVFQENGRIDVFPKTGAPFSIANGVKDHRAFGSHAEILRRQGVSKSSLAATDAENLQIGIARNESQIVNEMQKKEIDPTIRSLYAQRLKELSNSYKAANPSAQAAIIKGALALAADAQVFLPEYLKMRPLHDRAFRVAPKFSDGTPQIRILRRFLLLRTASAGLEPTLYIFERPTNSVDGMHLQVLHGNLGNFALDLEADGKVAGGVIALTYDDTSEHLVGMALDSNGMVPFHQSPQNTRLTPEEQAWLRNQIDRLLN